MFFICVSMVFGSVSRESNVTMILKLSSASPLVITWFSGLPVTWKNTSSCPMRWNNLNDNERISLTWSRNLLTMNCCLTLANGFSMSKPTALSAWLIIWASIRSLPGSNCGIGANATSPIRRYGIFLPGPQSFGGCPAGCIIGGNVDILARSIRLSRSVLTCHCGPRRISANDVVSYIRFWLSFSLVTMNG